LDEGTGDIYKDFFDGSVPSTHYANAIDFEASFNSKL